MQNIEEFNIKRIFETASPAERIIWNQVYLDFGSNIGIRQLHFVGPIAGTEFLTYQSGKMYLAYRIELNTSAINTGFNNVTFYDRNNVAGYTAVRNYPYWNSTAGTLGYMYNPIILDMQLFSRYATSGYNQMKFIGFRINY